MAKNLFSRFKKINNIQKISILITFIYFIVALIIGFGYNNIFHPGDISFFYSMANNIVNGEVFFKDFIHFRSPGSQYINALFLAFFGGMESIFIAVRLEHFIFAPIFLFTAVWVLFKNSKILLPVIVVLTLSLLFLHGVFQLRLAIPVLIISIYYIYFKSKFKPKYLPLIIGILLGVNLFFGQETAILTGFLVFIFELRFKLKNIKLLTKSLGLMLLGFIGVLFPFLIYLALNNALGNFFYYIFYYAILIQPSGMDMPFPEINGSNLFFILPFAVYLTMFIAAYLNKNNSYLREVSVFLIPLGLVQLVSMLGRVDTLHLSFVMPTVLLSMPVTIKLINDIDKSKINNLNLVKLFTIITLVITLMFMSIVVKSAIIILAALVVFFSLSIEYKEYKSSTIFNVLLSKYVYGLLLTFAIGFLTLSFIVPNQYRNELKGVFKDRIKSIIVTFNDKDLIKDISFSGDYSYVNEINKEIDRVKPEYLFSFPIQPYYYTRVKHHATSIITFEPQTTAFEQDQTIEQLKVNKPEMVIMDVYQVNNSPQSVYKIVNFITSNYKISKVIDNDSNHIWIMIPKNDKDLEVEYKPALNYHKNYKLDRSDMPYLNLFNYKYGISNAIMVNEKVEINLEDYPGATKLKTSVALNNNLNSGFQKCGYIEIYSVDDKSDRRQYCHEDGNLELNISGANKVIFYGFDSKPVVWNDVTLTN